MYSYEDRLRAVQLYIKLGKRLGLTIRQLGYPTKNALKTWYGEYEQRLELPAGYARQPRYSQAHKERAVEHHRDHGHCIAATIKALGYPSRSLLSAWIHELNPQARAHAVGRSPELVADELTEGPKGSVLGKVMARQVDVHGKTYDSITASEHLIVRSTGQIHGTASYGKIEIERGGSISGSINPIDEAAAVHKESLASNAVQALAFEASLVQILTEQVKGD